MWTMTCYKNCRRELTGIQQEFRKWKGMNKASKAKYVSASKHMQGSYEKHMNAYRQKRKALIKSERENRSKIRMAKLNKRLARKRAMMLKKRNKRAKRIARKKAMIIKKRNKRAQVLASKKKRLASQTG